MHIETLKIFCDLVDLQSFSLAAERNFITQSAVSQQIRSLEDKFKRRLLERVRGRREVRLTAAGEVFHREAKNVLAAYDQLQENLRGLVGKIGGTVKQVAVTRPDGEELVAADPEITVKNGADLELWFESNNRYGCHAYDSANGANYHFEIE